MCNSTSCTITYIYIYAYLCLESGGTTSKRFKEKSQKVENNFKNNLPRWRFLIINFFRCINTVTFFLVARIHGLLFNNKFLHLLHYISSFVNH